MRLNHWGKWGGIKLDMGWEGALPVSDVSPSPAPVVCFLDIDGEGDWRLAVGILWGGEEKCSGVTVLPHSCGL